MASVSNEPAHPLAVGTWAPGGNSDSKSERYLAKRLAAAGADYKGVAITSFLLGAGVVALLWLVAGVLAEHWLVPGGLPRWARWTWLAAAVVALVFGIVRWVVPLIRYRVNLVYAARAIEREFPDLHNDLVNAVLVSSDEEGTSPRMIRSLKRRAARQLSGLPAEDSVVDRSLAVKLAYAVAALVVLACLYEVVAPKSLLTSSGRLLAPWTAVAPPSRVQIAPLQLSWRVPGDERDLSGDTPEGQAVEVRGATATMVRGRQLVVATEIRGLRDHEQPTIAVRELRDDGAVDPAAKPWQREMERPRSGGAGGRFVAVLPDAARGLDRSLELSLSAGDARTESLRVMAVEAPSLLVQEVRYDYPAYTRQAADVVRWQGDLRAVEGTKVTLMAVGNRPIGGGWIDFGCDGRRDKPLTVNASDPTRATASFELRLDPAAQQASYRLLFEPREPTGGSRQVITEDLQHRIEVLPDMAPEISLEEPTESPLRVPPDAPVQIRVRAVDPDFGLARVGLEVRLKDGPPGQEIVLLAEEKSGLFQGGSLLVPRQFGGQPGATLEYRGVAVDNRPQRPNETRTPWQALIIDERAPARQPQQKPRDGDRSDTNSGAEPSDKNQPPGEPGDAGQRPKNDKQPEGDQRGRNRKQPPGGEQSDGEEQPGNSQQSRDGRAGEPQAGKGQAQDGRGQAAQGGQDRQGRQDGQGKPGDAPSGQDKSGPGMGGQDKASQDKGGQGQGQSGDASGKAAQQKGAQQKDGPPKGDQQGGKQSGEKRNGDRANPRGQQPGDDQSAGKEQGAKRPGPQQGGEQPPRPGGQQGRGQEKQPPRDTVAADGTNDGEAMERILEHRQQQKRDGGQQTQNSGQPKDGQQQEGQQNDGQQQKDGQQQDGPSCTDGKPCGKDGCSTCNGGSKSGGSKPGSGGAGGQSGGGQPGGQQPGSQSQPGQQGEGGQQPGGNQQGGQKGQGGQQGGQQPGDQPGDGGQQRSEGAQDQGEGAQDQGAQDQGEGGQQGKGGQQGQGGQQQTGQPTAGGQSGAEGQPAGQKGEPEGQPGGKEAAGNNAAGQQAGTKPGEPADGQPGASGNGKNPAAGQQEQAGAGKEPGAGDQQPRQAGEGQPSSGSETGDGAWGGGEANPQTDRPDIAGDREQREMEWGDEDLSHARNAADLAVEHLRDSFAAGEDDVLDALGWTREQAQAFIDRWRAMRRLADSDDPRQRGEFERAVRSLGLRPGGVRSSRDVPTDVKGGQAEGRRSRPPSEYRDQVRAYLQGTSGE
jgi:hypothetical protein